MKTISVILKAKAGTEDTMRDALLAVAANVEQNEPETIGFHISQDCDNPCIFTTYERFATQAAMDLHNGSDAVAAFFAVAKPILDGEVVFHTCDEISAR